MCIGGEENFVFEVNSQRDIDELIKISKEENLEIFPLGSGSNTIFKDKQYNKIFVLMKNTGILKIYENPEICNIQVQAGEIWDDFVGWSVENGYSGLEALSAIPGTVGAGPIQNIGAYGSDISETIVSVEIFDLESQKIYEVPCSECNFSYRDSIFKQNLGKFIITSVTFSLKKDTGKLEIPSYKDVQLYFLDKKKKSASAKEIRNAIVEIRSKKIPWPTDIPNTGSFFKNPVVSTDLAGIIARQNPEMPYFKLEDGVKLYAGWLIEHSGLKGFSFGKIKINDKNALVLTNPNRDAEYKDLEKAVNQIKAQVFDKFEVELEVEPNIID
jgi:UDP-N-acetylmuramate dehydrogenase